MTADDSRTAGGVEPTRDQLDEWLVRSCGTGLPHGEVTNLAGALHALAYVLRQIDSTSSYKVNIGQCISASSGIRWVLDYFARAALATTPDPTARTGEMRKEQIARIIAGYMARRPWDDMAADRADLRALSRQGYDINEPNRDDCLTAADDILHALALPLPGDAS